MSLTPRTDRVQYAAFSGIDVWTGDAETPDMTFALIEGETPVLTVRTYSDRPDITPEMARNLAEALNKFADHHSPREQSIGLRLWGVHYPAIPKIVSMNDRHAANETVEEHNHRGYIGADGETHHDVTRVAASVYPNWEAQ